MTSKIIGRQVTFHIIAIAATRNNIFNDIAFGVIYSIYSIVNIASNRIRLFGYLTWLTSTIKTFLFRDFSNLFFGQIPLVISFYSIASHMVTNLIERGFSNSNSGVSSPSTKSRIREMISRLYNLIATRASNHPSRLTMFIVFNSIQNQQFSELFTSQIYKLWHTMSLRKDLRKLAMLLFRQHLFKPLEVTNKKFARRYGCLNMVIISQGVA